jgi:hypothetical protein
MVKTGSSFAGKMIFYPVTDRAELKEGYRISGRVSGCRETHTT